MTGITDLLVIGGGINGAGIARDAAGRGLSVTLVEKDDLATHTSSASTKLIHGGLRYLENYEFRLVAEALREREVLLAAAPQIIHPMRFVMPHEPTMRPAWMLRIGLALYDTIGGKRSLPGTRTVDLTRPPYAGVLQERLVKGFEYSDCQVDDARLVVLAAMDAQERGATILTRTQCTALERLPDRWRATLRDAERERVVEARVVINAAGPWVDRIAKLALGTGTPAHLRLVKGSHIIVPRLYPGEHAYIFQQPDGRIVFAIPYQGEFTLIGTTDVLYTDDLDHVAISAEERAYLRDAAALYFRKPIADGDVVHSYAGVRPLYEDKAAKNSTVTRDYVFELDTGKGDGGAAPILSIYGGKITTFRKLAEHALARLGKYFPIPGGAWTADAVLPGGDIAGADFTAFAAAKRGDYPWMPPAMVTRLAGAYGSRMDRVVGTANALDQLGEHLGGTLYAAELRYLIDHEYARTAEDVLWRRSKLGLHLSSGDQRRVEGWFASNAAERAHFA